MTARISMFSALALLVGLAVLLPGHAQANKSDKIQKALSGQLIISDEALPAPDPEDVKGTIKSYKQLTLKSIKGNVVDGVATWDFHFTAFMKSTPKTSNLVLEFYTDDKEKLFVADKRLTGADPKVTILASTVKISEDENLNRNRNYVVNLVANQGKKSVILATTKIATK
jgi:hypothetical protein